MQHHHQQQQSWRHDGRRIGHVAPADALADDLVQPPPDEQQSNVWDDFVPNGIGSGIPGFQYDNNSYASSFGHVVQDYTGNSNNIGSSESGYVNFADHEAPLSISSGMHSLASREFHSEIDQHSNNINTNATDYGNTQHLAVPPAQRDVSRAITRLTGQSYLGANYYNATNGYVANPYANSGTSTPYGLGSRQVSNHSPDPPPPYSPETPLQTPYQPKFDCVMRVMQPRLGTGHPYDRCCDRDRFQGLANLSLVEEHLLLQHGVLCPECRRILRSKPEIETHQTCECPFLYHDHEGRPTAAGEIQQMIEKSSPHGAGLQSAMDATGESQYDVQGQRHIVAGQQGAPISTSELKQIITKFMKRAPASNAKPYSQEWYNAQADRWLALAQIWAPRFNRDDFEAKNGYAISPYFEKNKANEKDLVIRSSAAAQTRGFHLRATITVDGHQ